LGKSSDNENQSPSGLILSMEFGFQSSGREAQRLGGDYFELESGHDAMISMPDKLAQTLNRAIGKMG